MTEAVPPAPAEVPVLAAAGEGPLVPDPGHVAAGPDADGPSGALPAAELAAEAAADGALVPAPGDVAPQVPAAALVRPSDAPVRVRGTRARSGNAMARTRAALLDGAHRCLAERGLRATTMVDVAASSGVAKATLYNHFRTKHDVVTALVEDRVRALAAVEGEAEAVLAAAAEALSQDAALRRLAAEEPAALVPLLVPGTGPGWDAARARLEELVGPAAEVALRWLLSCLLWPVEDPGAQAAQVLRRTVAPVAGDPTA